MPALYIANATKQEHTFAYRLPERVGEPILQPIRAGGQVRISGDLNQIQIDAIIEHHRIYGMISVEEAARVKEFAGLCYSIDKPISFEKLTQMVEHNDDVLTERGKKMRAEAAVATNEQLEQQIIENRMPDRLQSLEMSVEEVDRDQRDPTPGLAEGVRVTRTAPAPTRSRRRG